MKGRFYAAPNLMMLEAVLREKEAYAVINVSTTGLDNSSFSGHMPIRVCVQEYVFDSEQRQYKEGLSFDHMVKCSDAALQYAIASENDYDVFANGGIDRISYMRGDGVLSQEEFQKKFVGFMESLKPETMVIANNALFVKTYLDKIGCGDDLQKRADDGKILDQMRMTKEYFIRNSVQEKRTTLESLRDHLAGTQGGKIIGGDNRIRVIHDFVTKYGRDRELLEDERTAYFRAEDKEIHDDMVRKGREHYQNADYTDKLNILVKQGVIHPESVINRNGDSDLNKLFDILEGKHGNKGFTVMQAATTGFSAGNAPIQLTAVAYELRDGLPVQTKAINMNIQADRYCVTAAIQEAEKGKFDAFRYTGIDLEKYLLGDGVLSQEDALNRISMFFKAFDPKDYPIVTNGTSKTGNSYTQECLKSLGSLPDVFDAPHTDFIQAVKEYCYLMEQDEMTGENAIVDINRWNEKDFRLESIANHNDISAIDSTKLKCLYIGMLIKSVAEQHKEMLYGKPLHMQKEIADAEENFEESFMEDDGGYDNIISDEYVDSSVYGYTPDDILEEITGGDFIPQVKEPVIHEDDKNGLVVQEDVKQPAKQDTAHSYTAVEIDVNAMIQVIQEQNKLIAEQNRALMQAMEHQNQILRAVMGIDKVQEQTLDYSDNKSVIDYVETLKERIADVSDNIPDVRASFQAASAQLSKGQCEGKLSSCFCAAFQRTAYYQRRKGEGQ